MKFYFPLIAALFFSFSFHAQTLSPDDITGVWVSNLGKGRVEIKKDSTGQKYEGRIVWLKVPKYENGTEKRDLKNPDKTKRQQPLIGLLVVKSLTFKNNRWEDGTIYDPESGKTYSCRAALKNNKLELRGYAGVSEIGRTQTWERYAGNDGN